MYMLYIYIYIYYEFTYIYIYINYLQDDTNMFECWNGLKIRKYIFTHLELYTYAVVIQTYKHIYMICTYVYFIQ